MLINIIFPLCRPLKATVTHSWLGTYGCTGCVMVGTRLNPSIHICLLINNNNNKQEGSLLVAGKVRKTFV